MKHWVTILLIMAIVCGAATTMGSNNYSLISVTDSIYFRRPPNFPPPVYTFSVNPLTTAGFELGRDLFYDPVLSKDKSIACNNCHQPFAAFANLDHAVSHGVDFCFGTRNAPPLFNLAWQKEFMWDGGVKHIEVSPLNALTNSCEMANSLDTIVDRLKSDPQYVHKFQQVFGNSNINSQQLLRVLAQFTSMLISADSKYDKHIRKESGGDFSADEENGYEVFSQKCAPCHREPLFTDLSFRNNGLDLVSEDPGRDTITNNEPDRGKFRVPSLRNIELTAPYMHDGRFETLEQVLEHYSSGMKRNANLDTVFENGKFVGIELSGQEKKALIAFLKTLTDRDFVNDKRFQPPGEPR